MGRTARNLGGALQMGRHLACPSGAERPLGYAIAGMIWAVRQFVPALLLIHTPKGYSMLVGETVLASPK